MSLGVRNPRTGLIDYSIDPLGPGEVAARAAALREAQPGWAALGPEGRAQVLLRWAEAIDRRTDEIAEALTIDTGRRGISRMEVAGLARLVRRWAEAAPRLIGDAEAKEAPTSIPGISVQPRLVPYPLIGAISPWNFPLTLALIDAVPALAAGCAVLVKPSEVTPRFIAPLMRSVGDVPELAAVLDLIEGDGATGAALVEQVDFLCFTGSVATGRKVSEAAARAFIPASLELGGKDPMIVLASADPVAAAATALRASVVNTGQACQSIERIYVARAIAGPFLDALVREAEKVRLNAADIAEGDIGPFIFARQAEIVAAQIDDARAKGARILAGGEVEEHGGGLYLRPTILADVTPEMAVMREETFGPVLPVTPFDTVEEAVALANQGSFGLSAAVIAGTTGEAAAVAARLEAGAVSINDGALTSMVWEAEKSSFKLSGLGPSRMGASGLMRFFRRQALIVQQGAPLPLGAYSEEALGR
ncbi:MAG: aldehyde dehydrogenase family protein [Allosphingosinicella sp.]|uniref:aldehyde dehydrogenase family protein n=1 Tax=Allosphingosinicella sp. TaxID=2823234 RepID=UPI0039456A55